MSSASPNPVVPNLVVCNLCMDGVPLHPFALFYLLQPQSDTNQLGLSAPLHSLANVCIQRLEQIPLGSSAREREPSRKISTHKDSWISASLEMQLPNADNKLQAFWLLNLPKDVIAVTAQLAFSKPPPFEYHSAFEPTVSEASKRGWRTEGVGAKKSFLCHRLRPLFWTLFHIPPYEKGDTILGPANGQPPPANPFRNF